MTAQDFLSAISQIIYLALFAISAARLVRLRTAVALDTFLFFGVVAAILVLSDAARALGFEGHPTVAAVSWVAIAALPYLLLHLAHQFQPRRWWTLILATLSLLAVAGIGLVLPQPWPPLAILALVAQVVLWGGFASVAFLRAADQTHGGTRRRMQAVALGSGLFATTFVLVGAAALTTPSSAGLAIATQVVSLAAVVCYFVGFAPPAILQRGWQEPAIRSALAASTDLAQLGDPHDIGAQFAAAAAAATGAQGSAVGLWDERAGVLQFRQPDGTLQPMAVGEAISGRAFERQRPVMTSRAERDAPERADEYRRSGIRAIVSAPVTSGDRKLGVLSVYARRPPVFTDDVVNVVRMLAEQAALVLRNHELLREAAQVRAMAEMTRLKEDFLSVVAHDIRTPLTTILINAELLRESVSADARDARRAGSLHDEALRLKQLVEDYLGVARSQEAATVPGRAREDVDVAALVRDAVARLPGSSRVRVEGSESARGSVDAQRIRQLVENLVGNALKYSPDDQPVVVGVEDTGAALEIRVSDQGIGIPEEDLSRLFERFYRGTNADDRRYSGLGLGLYIARQVAEEHGGTITVTSAADAGTTFVVTLPRQAAGPPPPASEAAAPEPISAPAATDADGLGLAPAEATGEAGI